MAATIRLYRLGKKKFPSYRIVVIDKRKKRNGVYRDQIGFYSPLDNTFKLEIDEKKLAYWTEKGALVSEGFRKLLHRYQSSKKD